MLSLWRLISIRFESIVIYVLVRQKKAKIIDEDIHSEHVTTVIQHSLSKQPPGKHKHNETQRNTDTCQHIQYTHKHHTSVLMTNGVSITTAEVFQRDHREVYSMFEEQFMGRFIHCVCHHVPTLCMIGKQTIAKNT